MGFVLALHLVRAYSCKMKNTTRNILLSLPLFLISLGYGATVPTMDVTVSSANGKVAYKGTTNANGIFATGNLEPGNYVVEFHSKSAAVNGIQVRNRCVGWQEYPFRPTPSPERKSLRMAVAMKVAVAAGTKITGQVASGLAATKAVTNASAGSQSNAKVKVINGKRYVWVIPQKSSLEGGHWVEESAAANAQSNTVRQSLSTSSASWPDGLLACRYSLVRREPASRETCGTRVESYRRRGSNPHTLASTWILSPARLPVPPRRRCRSKKLRSSPNAATSDVVRRIASNSAPSIRLL